MTRPVSPAAESRNARSGTGLRYAALLRGINVGGKRMVPMAALLDIFGDASCAEVRTYIQSGNVVFAASPQCAKRVPAVVAAAILKRFKFQPLVLVRSAVELDEIASRNPFVKAGLDERSLHVAFLSEPAGKSELAALNAKRANGERFQPRGTAIFLHMPNGLGKSQLANAFNSPALARISTLRNWRTVLKLREMTKSPA